VAESITVSSAGVISYLRVDEQGKRFRSTFPPSTSLEGLPVIVRDAAVVEWTAERIAAQDAVTSEFLSIVNDPAALQENIRAEAERRIALAIGARNNEHAKEIQITATTTATNIVNKKVSGVPLTPEENMTDMLYSFLFPYIRAVRDTQQALEISLTENFTDDALWPPPVTPDDVAAALGS